MAPNNPLSIWGNDKTMNLNTLILTNIQSSPYFKVQLFELKTFHEVVDEIYYKVDHLEPWEKGSRKTSGQTGMCGGVRGVGAGGIVSSAFCLLYKMFTLKLTRKQVNNIITHSDSPYIRGLGFMYIRYTQQPSDLWDWYEPYLNDEEELDVKAGGGHVMTIGEMLRQWLVKLEWYSTLFPRIPVPIQKDIDVKLRSRPSAVGYQGYGDHVPEQEPEHIPDDQVSFGEAERAALSQRGGSRSGRGGWPTRDGYHGGSRSRHSPPRRRSPRRSPSRHSPNSRSGDFSKDLDREKDRQRREREKDLKPFRHDKRSEQRSWSQSRDRKRSRSLSRDRRILKPVFRDRKRSRSFSRDRNRSRSLSRDREGSWSQSRHKKRTQSKSPERKRTRSQSPDKKKARPLKNSTSQFEDTRARSQSHDRRTSRSNSAERRRSKSSSPERKGSGLNSRERHRSHSMDQSFSHHNREQRVEEKKKHKSKKKRKEKRE